MERYIAFDCETGGLTSDCSLLTAYFVILEADLTTIVGELDLKIKPDAGKPYVVSGEALGINGINLTEHDKTALPQTAAATAFYNFLNEHNRDGRMKFIPVGHNVVFDEEFLKGRLLSAANWNKYISYRRMDTGVVAQYLKLTGHLPKDISGSLGSLATALGVNLTNAHNAKADTIATVKVLRKMIKMMEKK
jgi:DNA polymerase III alpha subunit (gram-positive type)